MNMLLLSLNVGAVPAFLEQCVGGLARPLRLGYITDAAEGLHFAAAERTGVAELGYELVDISARRETAASFAEVLGSLDAVYVAGGETFLLLEALRSNGTGDVLAERVRAGLPYIGCSAGSIITGPSVTPAELMDSRDVAPGLSSDRGLGLIDKVIVPHADGKLPPYPAELIARIVETYGDKYPLLLLRDGQALHVSGAAAEVIPSL
ncbi:Type 1 glutamine amidotransferase-like domain-containing protein [Corynebacterium flavescens]|uniref:Type 1 glutamine amidotransferase-like domain-containing protein n=1 Tax=Corynebacterium flavescens TaxID=28028 RepID=UPI003FD24983